MNILEIYLNAKSFFSWLHKDRSPIQEEECGDDIENLSCNKDESTSPVEEHTSKQVDEPSEPINASLRQDPDQIECTTESVGKLIIDEVKEETSNTDTEIQKETTDVQSTEEESISAIPIISKENDKPRDTKIPQKGKDILTLLKFQGCKHVIDILQKKF